MSKSCDPHSVLKLIAHCDHKFHLVLMMLIYARSYDNFEILIWHSLSSVNIIVNE